MTMGPGAESVIDDISKRTGLPHTTIHKVFDTLRDIVVEKLAVLSDVTIPHLMRMTCEVSHRGNHRLHVATYKSIYTTVGRDVDWVKSVKPSKK